MRMNMNMSIGLRIAASACRRFLTSLYTTHAQHAKHAQMEQIFQSIYATYATGIIVLSQCRCLPPGVGYCHRRLQTGEKRQDQEGSLAFIASNYSDGKDGKEITYVYGVTGVERARYEADQARQRYMSVDPQYRLVAATLEAEWNDKLRELDQEQQEYERQSQKERRIFRSEGIENVKALASDFPRLWKDERISARDRKRMVRLLIQDVALKKEEKENKYSYSISVKVRFRGGMIKTLNVPGPKRVWQKQKTSEEIVSQIDRLLNHHVQSEIADILNKSGLLSLRGRPFTAAIIYNIQRQYGLKSRYERLRENNLLTLKEISTKMQISKVAVKKLEKSNMIKSYNCTDKRKKLYECSDNDFIEMLPEIFEGGAV
jgi:hypothetical protein